jgi:hypothetical protein
LWRLSENYFLFPEMIGLVPLYHDEGCMPWKVSWFLWRHVKAHSWKRDALGLWSVRDEKGGFRLCDLMAPEHFISLLLWQLNNRTDLLYYCCYTAIFPKGWPITPWF